MAAPSLAVTQGDTLTWRFTLGSDITGWTAKFTLKPQGAWELSDASATYSGSIGSGLTVVDAETGVLDLQVAAATTNGWSAGAYQFDLQITNGAEIRTVQWDDEATAYGLLLVNAAVTLV